MFHVWPPWLNSQLPPPPLWTNTASSCLSRVMMSAKRHGLHYKDNGANPWVSLRFLSFVLNGELYLTGRDVVLKWPLTDNELTLLVSLASQTLPTNASARCFQYQSDWLWGLLGLRLPCLYASVNCSASFYTAWATGCWFSQLSTCSHLGGCTAFMLSGLFVNHLASFQAVRPAFKPFGLVSKLDYFALYNWKWPNQFKNLMTGL